jgi:hypothetical protein
MVRVLTLFCLATVGIGPAAAQNARFYRPCHHMAQTTPPFGLAKVQRDIDELQRRDILVLDSRTYGNLTIAERFTYVMLHAELCLHNSTGELPKSEEAVDSDHSDAPPELVGAISTGFGVEDERWSQRQRSFLHSHRAECIVLLRKTIQTKREAGTNLLNGIVEIDAFELIPDILAVFRRNQDLDILEACLLLMKDGKYPPFLKSTTYRKLFGGGRDENVPDWIVANQANIDLTVKRAMDFYHTKWK